MTCEGFEARLISGDKPSDDPALAAHVGSCLRCFRTAADIREVPRLAALIRKAEREGEGSDPGAAFWERFPGQVSAAWVSTRGNADSHATLSLWERVPRWLRRPVPAALTGAACAAGLALLVMQPSLPGSGERVADPASGPEGGAAASDPPGDLGTTAAVAYDAVAELDVEVLATLRDGLSRALGSGENAAGAATDPEVASATALSDPTTVVEDLEMLDEIGLLALRDRLGKI